MIGISFSICCLVFLIMLMIFYFLKKKIDSIDNKIFTRLLVINFIGVFIDVGGFLCFKVLGTENIISIAISKIYLVYYITYATTLFMYVYEISTSKFRENILKISGVLVIVSLLILTLPIDLYFKDNIGYSQGPSVNLTYAFGIFELILMLYYLFKYVKKIGIKKYVPLLAFVFLQFLTSMIQKTHPEITIMLLVDTIVTYLMYFTIENPDLKLLEEAHKAKEISDNANEEKTMFLYNMTNEIRDITRDIDRSADGILDEMGNKKINADGISDMAREIKASTAKFTTMTNEILDISQVDSSNIKVYNDKYNIKLIIKELVQLYKGKCEKKGLEFRTNIASDLPEYLYGDSVGVKKSLSVILDNSINYTDNGYIEFTIDTISKGDITRLIITIEDSGIGMKAEELSKIFNSRGTKDEKLNLNKNLYSVRKLITVMGGTIVPSSSYGKGTTMKIVLDQKIAESDSKLNKYEKALDKKKILLVDDNDASVKLITKMITDTSIILEISNSGKDCLDKIRDKEKYDLILLSEKMEPLDGITVMKKLKEIRNFNTKVILLTRDNDYEYNEEYLKYGFVDYILKPMTKDTLLEKINKHLNCIFVNDVKQRFFKK